MPWTAQDVDKHNKGLSAHQKRIWVAAANNALRMCESKGEKDCDARAIRIANAAVKKTQESIASPALLASLLPQDSPLIERISAFSTAFGEVSPTAESVADSLDALIEAVDMLAQDDSYSSRMSTVSMAVSLWARAHALTINADVYGYASYAYIVDMYPDVVIFNWNRQLWRAGYTIDSENKATLDDPQQVRLYYAPANVTVESESITEIPDPARIVREPDDDDVPNDGDESGGLEVEEPDEESAEEAILAESGCIALNEAAVKPDGTAKICLITPGWGSRGYYSPEVLRRDGPIAFPANTHMHFDHQTEAEQKVKPERSLGTLAAVLKEDAHWEDDGPNGAGLYAEIKVFEDKRPILNEIAPYIGTSIFASGLGKEGEVEGRKGRIVEALLARPTNTVDFVTKPGRGGKVLELVESARAKLEGPATQKARQHTEKVEENQEMDQEQIQAIVNAAVTEAVTKAVSDTQSESQKKITELQAMLERQNEALRVRDAREIVMREVARFSNLGDRAKTRVVNLVMSREVPLTESNDLDVDAVKASVESYAKDEIEYLTEAGALSDGKVRGMGSSAPEMTLEEANNSLVEAGKALGLSEVEAKRFAQV